MRLERGARIKKSGFEQSKTPHFEGVSLHAVIYKGFLRTSKLDDFLPWTSILSKGRTRCHTKGTWTSCDVESSQARKTSPENKPILIFNLSICNCWHFIRWFQIQNLSSIACQILLNEFVPNKCKKENRIKSNLPVWKHIIYAMYLWNVICLSRRRRTLVPHFKK